MFQISTIIARLTMSSLWKFSIVTLQSMFMQCQNSWFLCIRSHFVFLVSFLNMPLTLQFQPALQTIIHSIVNCDVVKCGNKVLVFSFPRHRHIYAPFEASQCGNKVFATLYAPCWYILNVVLVTFSRSADLYA